MPLQNKIFPNPHTIPCRKNCDFLEYQETNDTFAKNIGTKNIGIWKILSSLTHWWTMSSIKKLLKKGFLIKEDGYEVEDPFFKQWIIQQSRAEV